MLAQFMAAGTMALWKGARNDEGIRADGWIGEPWGVKIQPTGLNYFINFNFEGHPCEHFSLNC